MMQVILLLAIQRTPRLRQQETPESIDVPSGPAVAGTVKDAESIGVSRIHERGAQRQARVRQEIRGGAERHFFGADRMPQTQLRRMQTKAPECRPAIQRVAEDREAVFRG